MEQLDDETVLQMLDYPAYFNLLKKPIPEGRANILNELKSNRLIVRHDIEGWNITNLGSLLFARSFSDFPDRKAFGSRAQTGWKRTGTEPETWGTQLDLKVL